MRRKRLWTYGARPRTIAVFTEWTTRGRYTRVQWPKDGKRLTKSYPDTGAGRKEAKAFAEQLAAEFTTPEKTPDVTLRGLWDAYVNAEFDALRPKTITNYRAHWRSWETFADRETPANAVTRETLDNYRKELRTRGIAVSQVRKSVELVKRVYRFGLERSLVLPNRLTDYRVRVAKEERTKQGAEYTADEALRLIAALNPDSSTQWRAWLFCTIAHYCGARSNAILHLAWSDITDDAIIWRARYDKVGRERFQPLPRQVSEALDRASAWARKDGYQGLGCWVFYTPRRLWKGDRPMTYQGINWMIREAEKRAGVPHVHMNAAHRFRRGAFGNVIDLTGGDVNKAMQWIGDTDPKVASRYLKQRDERDREVADLLSHATDMQSESEGMDDDAT